MLDVKVEIPDSQVGRFGALFSVEPLLREKGVRLSRDLQSAQILWIEDKILRERETQLGADLQTPTIVHEHCDSASLGGDWIRLALTRPNVLAVTKEHTLRNASLHNGPHVRNRVHLTFLTESAAARTPSVQLDLSSLSKIRTIHPVSRSPQFRNVRNQQYRPFAARQTEVCFAGGLRYDIEQIAEHRRKAIEEILALGGQRKVLVGTGAALERRTYYDVLSGSKIFVSPYGYGEFSWKDYEALFCGCILIKPECDYVRTYGFDIFDSSRHYVKCAPDLSDLRTVIEMVLDDLPRYEAMSFDAHREIVEAVGDEALATDVAAFLHELAHSAGLS